jgi:plastocyanin
MRRIVLAAGLGVLALLSVACSSYTTSPVSPTVTSAPPAGAMTVDIVGIRGARSFSPNPSHLPWGQPVVWHNVDTVVHRVVLNDGELDTGNLAPGAFSQPMALVTPLGYHCSIHPGMVGTFIVEDQ